MALVRVKLIGSGTKEDHHRANLPTYREVLTNVAQGYVIALIPDADLHDTAENLGAQVEQTGHGPMIVGLSPEHHAAWHTHLDKRYKERKGDFRPEIV